MSPKVTFRKPVGGRGKKICLACWPRVFLVYRLSKTYLIVYWQASQGLSWVCLSIVHNLAIESKIEKGVEE